MNKDRSAQAILDELDCGSPHCSCARSARAGSGLTHCPSHDDAKPSLSVKVTKGRPQLKCFAGCSSKDVVAQLSRRGVSVGTRSPSSKTPVRGAAPTPANHRARVHTPAGLTLARYAEAKRLPVEFLRGLGLGDLYYVGAPAIRIPHRDESGAEAGMLFRVALDGPDRFKWRRGSRPTCYGLERLGDARASGRLVLVEGQSDAQTLWHAGEPALGLPSAAASRELLDELTASIAEIPSIIAVREPGAGGDQFVARIAASAIGNRVRVLSCAPFKDPSEMWINDPASFADRWRDAADRAVPIARLATRQVEERERQLWEKCGALALDPHVLDRFAAAVERAGVVGEERAVKLVYLVVTSRLFAEPVSAVVKGPSSGGKSFTVAKTLEFFPPEAFYALSAMSDRALAYSDEPLKHRTFVLYEAAGLSSDMASYLMRSLLSEGRVRYETVEKTKDGLRSRFIEREGPTNLLLTTTAVRLHPENETRLISIPVTDTREQTAAVIRRLATGSTEYPADALEQWRAYQSWLACGERRVVVPYAPALAAAVPPVAVRLRRDFRALLNLVRAHALVHRMSRERDDLGRIVATLDDYAAVRSLVVDLVAEGVGASVSGTIRETVGALRAAIEAGERELSVTALAKRIPLDRSSTQRRVGAAVEHGYLRNLEIRPRRAARLVLGEPLPDELTVLPSPESVRACIADAGDAAVLPQPPDADPSPPTITRHELGVDLSEFPMLRALRDLDAATGSWIDWIALP